MLKVIKRTFPLETEGKLNRLIQQDSMSHGIVGETKAVSNMPQGFFFEVNGVAYRALKAIATGETLVVGVNCEAVSLASVINEINKEA